MARKTIKNDAALVNTIDGLYYLPRYRLTSKFNKFIEGLMFQVATRIKNGTPFPRVKGWKNHSSNWLYALIEIRRNEIRLIKKQLRSIGL